MARLYRPQQRKVDSGPVPHMLRDLHDPRWRNEREVAALAAELGLTAPKFAGGTAAYAEPWIMTVRALLSEYLVKHWSDDRGRPDADRARAAGVDTLIPRRLRRTRSTGSGAHFKREAG